VVGEHARSFGGRPTAIIQSLVTYRPAEARGRSAVLPDVPTLSPDRASTVFRRRSSGRCLSEHEVVGRPCPAPHESPRTAKLYDRTSMG
jgi:hypothetical protein